MTVPVFITCRDRVECLTRLVDRLETMEGVGPIVLVDNDSAWPPLLDYLAATPHQVVRVGRNAGHRAVWDLDLLPELRRAGPFVVTDPDVVPDDTCPPDAVAHLTALLDGDPSLVKVGLGLRIDDLPGHWRADEVRDWESQFWEAERSPGVYAAAVDTTFAVYRAGAGPDIVPALRTGPPYVARHLPWYDDPEAPDAEEVFYRARARTDSTNWHLRTLEPGLAAALERRRRLLRGAPDHPLLDGWAAETAAPEELRFAELAGALVRLAAPGVVVETGVGDGRVTRRVAAAAGGAEHLCFEADPELRAALAGLAFFATVPLAAEPTAEDLARADVTVLASDDAREELEQWCRHARPGALVLARLEPAGVAAELDLPLTELQGAVLARHPGDDAPGAQRARADALRDELEAVRATVSWKVTRPLRTLRR